MFPPWVLQTNLLKPQATRTDDYLDVKEAHESNFFFTNTFFTDLITYKTGFGEKERKLNIGFESKAQSWKEKMRKTAFS